MAGTELRAAPDDERDAPGSPVVPGPRDAPPDDHVADRPAGSSVTDGAQGGCGLAWLVRSVTHVPGVLHLDAGRLRFVSTRGVIFDDAPAALAIAPARTSRGGFRLVVGGERLRLHVVRFDGATEVATDLRDREAAAGLLTAGEPSAGPVWRQLLAAESAAGTSSPRRAVATEDAPPLRDRGWRPVRSRRACAAPAPWY